MPERAIRSPNPSLARPRCGWRGWCAVCVLLVAIGAPTAVAQSAPEPTTRSLRLESPQRALPGPICVRTSARPYQNLAGFSLAVGSILLLAPGSTRRRDGDCNDAERSPRADA